MGNRPYRFGDSAAFWRQKVAGISPWPRQGITIIQRLTQRR